ncbi:hypothetical protein SAE02_76830 [Skermanella aerolata]|uniref:Uncharacterized protein n=1 Tax=Skermanella aerolata TaxID=393310 RepID=A0A512E494_9PROT|nr:hypothetical protein SAE02_76830 [Skermanella aerolata]
MVLLSVKAGLRAMEIAGLRRWHVMDAGGAIDDTIHLEDAICRRARAAPSRWHLSCSTTSPPCSTPCPAGRATR